MAEDNTRYRASGISLTTTFFPAANAQKRRESTVRLLLVHGIAQQGRSATILKDEWIGALTDGLRAVGIEPANFNAFVPFFGDELVRLVGEYGERSPDRDKFFEEAAAELAAGDALAPGQRPEAGEGARRELGPYENIPGDFGDRGGEMGAALPEPARKALRLLDHKFPDATDWSLRHFLNVVYVYMSSPEVRREIDQSVLKVLDGDEHEPILLVGHSLGSVIAYNIMQERPLLPWRGFVTVGSPLGIHAIANRLPHYEPRIPALKSTWKEYYPAAWLNAFDPRDIVALNPLLPPYWAPANAILNLAHVNNFTPNRHGIRGYLSDRKIAAAINAALKNCGVIRARTLHCITIAQGGDASH
jgi:hypothetical protein